MKNGYQPNQGNLDITNPPGSNPRNKAADDAADEIKQLRAQNKELLEALENLADEYQFAGGFDDVYDCAMDVVRKAQSETYWSR